MTDGLLRWTDGMLAGLLGRAEWTTTVTGNAAVGSRLLGLRAGLGPGSVNWGLGTGLRGWDPVCFRGHRELGELRGWDPDCFRTPLVTSALIRPACAHFSNPVEDAEHTDFVQQLKRKAKANKTMNEKKETLVEVLDACPCDIFPNMNSLLTLPMTTSDLVKDEEFSVSSLLERANVNVGKGRNAPLVMFGDIAVDPELKNADPCTARGCLWPRATDGKVYVPFRISNQYSARERNTIIQGLASFARSTCIRFIPLDRQRDFVDIQYLSGCFSFVGRRGQGQVVSLSRQGCVFQSIIQHKLLHALGFNSSRLFELCILKICWRFANPIPNL
ncbi:unnamed protein product [Arctogadus glacialis]